MYASFPFGFEGVIWDLMVLVPDIFTLCRGIIKVIVTEIRHLKVAREKKSCLCNGRQEFLTYETAFFLFIAALENSVLPMGWDTSHTTLQVTSEL